MDHSDWELVIGKIKQNELDCRETAPLKTGDFGWRLEAQLSREDL